MWSKRLFICIVALILCAGASLSTGSGTAAAITPKDILRVADEIAPMIAKKFGFAQSAARDGFVAQATRFKPVTTEAELNNLRFQWTTFERKPLRPGEVVPRNGGVTRAQKFAYEQANQLWCETTVSLLEYPEKSFWEVTIDQVKGQVVQMLPLIGPPLAIHNQLTEIGQKLEDGCICEAQAMIEVMAVQQTLC
jgi:hypothetical protein